MFPGGVLVNEKSAWDGHFSVSEADLRRTLVFCEDMQPTALLGEYELTHVALVLKLLRDNGCAIDSGADLTIQDDLRADILRRLSTPESTLRTNDQRDVRYEMLAFLQDFLGQRDLAEEQVVKLVSEQEADGGWRPNPRQPTAPHPTVLSV